MKSKLKRLDELCTKFEEEWVLQSDTGFLTSFLNRESIAELPIDELFAELAMVDIEKRWKAWSSRLFHDVAPREILSELDGFPSVEDYGSAALECGFPLSTVDFSELAACEIKARLNYGDVRKPVGLSQASELEARLPQVFLRCSKSTMLVHRFWGEIDIGRQAIGDPSFPAVTTQTQREKLVCAEGHDSLISRTQLFVKTVSKKFAIVKNESENRHFEIQDKQVRILEPQASVSVTFPFSVDLGSVFISVERSVE